MPRVSVPAAWTLDLAEVPLVFAPLFTHLQPGGPARKRWRGLAGGRGSGKSWALATSLIADMAHGHVRCVAAREVMATLQDSMRQLILDVIERLGGTSFFKITDREISYAATDSLITFRGISSSTGGAVGLKSLEGFNRLVCDEAQQISRASFEIIGPTFRMSGSSLDFAWNPMSPDDPVDQFFHENAEDEDTLFLTAQWSDNPHFPSDLAKDKDRDFRRDPSRAEHVWNGAYRLFTDAAMFTNVVVKEFETPSNARFFLGLDFGYAKDPTVLVRCYIEGRTLYIDHEAYRVGCEIDEMPLLFDKVPDARKWPITADNARPEIISALKRKGFLRIKPSFKGKGSVEDGVAFLQNFDAIVIHQRCKNTAREFSLCAWKVDPKTGDVLPVPAGVHDNAPDACRYAIEGLRRSNYTLANI